MHGFILTSSRCWPLRWAWRRLMPIRLANEAAYALAAALLLLTDCAAVRGWASSRRVGYRCQRIGILFLAMQVQAFHKVHGYPFASTMCIGNLRSGMDSLVGFGHTRDKKLLWKSLHYFGVIFVFAMGAGIGRQCVGIFGEKTIWLSCALLLVSLLLYVYQRGSAGDRRRVGKISKAPSDFTSGWGLLLYFLRPILFRASFTMPFSRAP